MLFATQIEEATKKRTTPTTTTAGGGGVWLALKATKKTTFEFFFVCFFLRLFFSYEFLSLWVENEDIIAFLKYKGGRRRRRRTSFPRTPLRVRARSVEKVSSRFLLSRWLTSSLSLSLSFATAAATAAE